MRPVPRLALIGSVVLLLLASAPPALATHLSPDPGDEKTAEPQDGGPEVYDEWPPPPGHPDPGDSGGVDDAADSGDSFAGDSGDSGDAAYFADRSDPQPSQVERETQDPVLVWYPEDEAHPPVKYVTTSTVAGRQAMLRTDGKAAIPRGAPKLVRLIIAAANRIEGKPYKLGGGHRKLVDRGYDCSGAVGFALIRAGLQAYPMTSGEYTRWGVAGAGRWATIHANKDHVYMEIAGLRLDTSAAGYGESGVRWRPVIGKRRGYKLRHPVGL